MSDTRNNSLKIPAANNRYMRWAVGLVIPLTVLGACQGGGTSGDEASQFNSDQASETVNIGFLYDVHSANVWTLDECESDLDIELTSFKQFAEVQRALEQGHVNAAAMGYQNSAQMLENQYEDFSIVSGVYTGAQHITVRKGSDINDWEDLVGKSVGLPPNSFVEMLFRAALDEAGIDYDDIDTVAFPGAGPPMLAALEAGDVDAIVAWESNSAMAETMGIGEYPSFDIQEGEIGDATSAFYVDNSLIESHPDVVQTVVDCLEERTDYLTSNPDTWVQLLMENTGLEEDVARRAMETGEMDLEIYSDSAAKIIEVFAENGLMEDLSEEFIDHVDEQFLN